MSERKRMLLTLEVVVDADMATPARDLAREIAQDMSRGFPPSVHHARVLSSFWASVSTPERRDVPEGP